ncbi:MAG: hypothetical protein M0R23_02850 [Bacteroidales bacterium]|jgi:hypothetical protein|nr:hypothetical protein [Bacteroidales bacterium]
MEKTENGFSLKEIQYAIKNVDEKRQAKDISEDERELMEMSAVALRNAERVAIAKLQKGIIKELEESTVELNKLSKTIRTRVSKMSKVPKALDKVETVIKEVVKILATVAKW